MFRRHVISIGTLAAAALLLESTLTRLLAVTQFYHFAFLVVSLALLGYGASGSILAIYPRLLAVPLNRLLYLVSIGFAASVGVAYGVVNYLPFDSYAIAWDRAQIIYFFSYYLALTIPFILNGIAVGAAIATSKGKSHLVYAANLLGSGLGALLAPLALWLAGVPGAVLLSAIIGLLAAITVTPGSLSISKTKSLKQWLPIPFLLGGIIILCGLAIFNFNARSPLGMVLSPYKGLAQVRRYPQSETIFSRWSAISRVDVLRNAGTHNYPGLSYEYQGFVPQQLGLSIDADSLLPIPIMQQGGLPMAGFLPEDLVFILNPSAKTLILEPGGGLSIFQALAGRASQVSVVVGNPLEYHAVVSTIPAFNAFQDSRVHTVFETVRTFMGKNEDRFGVIYYPLTDAYRPVSSGAFSLAEDYDLTVEAFKTSLEHLEPNGVLVITRWLQTPPSESLRLAATLMDSMAESDLAALQDAFIMYRGIQTMTILVKASGWTPAELDQARKFVNDRKFDLVWAPDIREDEVNRYNRLPEPVYYQAIQAMFSMPDRTGFYHAYPFEIAPPTDDHPFFFHFFKWEQTPEVLASMGHVWQPFGGSGYLVTIALLILALVLSFVLILLPLLISPLTRLVEAPRGIYRKAMLYFTFLGLAFL